MTLVALADRFGWAPRELLELTARDLVFWLEAADDYDRDKAARSR